MTAAAAGPMPSRTYAETPPATGWRTPRAANVIASGAESTSNAAQATIDAAPAACTASAGTSSSPGPISAPDVERCAVQHPQLVAIRHRSVNVGNLTGRPKMKICKVGTLSCALRAGGCHLELDGVKVVGEGLERAVARFGHVQEAGDRPLAEPRQICPRGQGRLDGALVAAERAELRAPAPRVEDRRRDLGSLLDQRLRLFLAPAPEAVRRRAAFLVPVLDEARADLRGDDPLAVEDADRVAAQPYQEDGDEVVGSDRLEQRCDVQVSYVPSWTSPNVGRTTSVSAPNSEAAPSA